jgi:hypothetical protein
MRPGSEWTTRGASGGGSSSTEEEGKRYEFDAPDEALRDRARVVRRELDRLEPERELRPERVPLELARVPPERRAWRDPEAVPVEVREVAAAPSLAPRTAPRAAAVATSPAFSNPAKPYTAPRRSSSLARGETAAAVAAAIAPASLSM